MTDPTVLVRGLNNAKSDHGFCDTDKSGNIGTIDIIARSTILNRCFVAEFMDVSHYFLQTFLGVLESPGIALGVLLHLQR